ncbi:hypothetical protein BSL78_21358 [Apostichopus japonicus]|uniref:Uncharacterized protein n=1 Tax=Stichopus japonicus TaxID=307972 RepID=A0A2G8K1E1_STIJA|nr:hypothetical protein BSL78_21358 [Apostichopus japonicus]
MAQNEEDPLGILTGPYALSSMTPPDLSSCSKEDVLEYFENTYSLNESIFTILKSEDAFYKSPDRLRLPLIFYFGHTASVYINKLILSNLITERVNFQLETILETGVDEMNWDDTEHYRMGGSYKWPALSEVVEFRRQVRAVIRNVIKNADFDLPITMDSPLWALFMGFDHERIHLETSSVLIRQLPLEMVRVPVNWRRGPTENGKAGLNEMVSVCATDVQMGKPLDFPSYGWDNEYPEINISVPAFAASKYLITNAELLEFVNDDGYRNESLWTTEGWQWKAFREAVHPTFWVCTNGCKSGCGGLLSSYSHCRVDVSQRDNNLSKQVQTYRLRTVCELVVMPWTWPVEVNHHEARAYCRWKGKAIRLLTEGEHNAIRDLQLRKKDTSCDPVFRKELHLRSNLNLAFCTSTVSVFNEVLFGLEKSQFEL